MDIVTHSMTGLFIGAAATSKKERLYAALVTGLAASALIDVLDVWLYPVDLNLYREYHRVFTHTLLGAPLYAGLAALPAWIWLREGYGFFCLISLLSILAHLGMDVVCEWPVLLFYPLSKKDFSLGWIVYSNRYVLIAAIILFMAALSVREKERLKQEFKSLLKSIGIG